MTDYYCKECAKAQNREKKFQLQLHKCMYCGETKTCYIDRPFKEFKKGKK